MKSERINVLIVPTNSCNLRCKYCYHASYGYKNEMISYDKVEKFLSVLSKEYNKISIFWHGGEPMLAGLDFYKHVVEYQKKLENENSCSFLNKMQTNATLINDEWIDFFIENEFGIGVSYDGPNNDEYRQQGELVFKNIKKLKEKGLGVGVISVVTNDGLKNIFELYDWFNANEISCKLNPLFVSGSAKSDYALDKETYSKLMISLFDKWFFDIDGKIRISEFEDMTLYYLGQLRRRVCCHNSCLFNYLALTPNGDLYPCARSWGEEYILGNIDDINTIEQVFSSPQYKKLVSKSMIRREKCKQQCAYAGYCRGGCNNIALIDGKIEDNGGWTCFVTKKLCAHVQETVKNLEEKDISNCNPRLKRYLENYFKINKN